MLCATRNLYVSSDYSQPPRGCRRSCGMRAVAVRTSWRLYSRSPLMQTPAPRAHEGSSRWARSDGGREGGDSGSLRLFTYLIIHYSYVTVVMSPLLFVTLFTPRWYNNDYTTTPPPANCRPCPRRRRPRPRPRHSHRPRGCDRTMGHTCAGSMLQVRPRRSRGAQLGPTVL
eukprot:9487819-Pyramimonas_sp.AAC.2